MTRTVFAPAAFAPSTYDSVLARAAEIHPIATLSAGLTDLAATLHAAPGPSYAYVYWDEVDSTGHEYGPSSPQFAAAAERCLDALDAGLRALPEGTVVLLAADHGQIDVDPATGGLGRHEVMRAQLGVAVPEDLVDGP